MWLSLFFVFGGKNLYMFLDFKVAKLMNKSNVDAAIRSLA